MKNLNILRILPFLLILLATSCNKDDDAIVSGEDDDIPTVPTDSTIIEGTAGNAIFFDESKISEGLLLVNDAGNNRVYLMDHFADIKHEWNLEFGIGNDAYLMDNGNFIALVWERISEEDAKNNGVLLDGTDIYSEMVI